MLVTIFLLIGQWSKKYRCVKCIKCVIFMDWQEMLKLCFILFLPVANPEIPLRIWKKTFYDNTSPIWEIFSPATSVKIVKVMCCLNLLFLQLKNYKRNKNQGNGINNQKQPWKGVLNIEWKKLLDNTTWKAQFLIQVWKFTKTNFFAGVFKLLY